VAEVKDEITRHLEKKHQEALVIEKQKITQAVEKQLLEQTTLEMSDLKKELAEKNQTVEKMRESELRLREEKRRLEDKEKEIDITIARKLDEAKKQTEETILKQLQDQYRLKDLEKEKVIGDLRRSLEDAQRKALQGSQQTQGEVAELDLEQSIRLAFPTDTVKPVEKGVRGADIEHTVKTQLGNVCGVILWESKRTKAWSNDWTHKLKEDLMSQKANIPLLVSSVLPEEARAGFGFVDGVYVVSPALALAVASILRQKLIDVAREKFIIQNKEGSSEKLYEYVTSHEFRQHIEAIVEVYQDMQQQILKERSAYEKIWKTREAHVHRLLSSTAGIIGSMRGLIGQSMPVVKGLEISDDQTQGLLA
jgi:hypothetical protein